MITPVYKDGKLFSVKSDKVFSVYKNGAGILDIINELQQQAIEMEKLKEKQVGSAVVK